jgi:DNA repair protein RecO (recombination protein O)
MRRRTAAICLRVGDYSETSQVAGFLTRQDGKVDLLAKGAKRPKGPSGGPIDLLAEGELVYIPSAHEGLGTLVEFTETAPRPGLRRDERRLNVGLFMLELVAALLEEADPHVEVFDLLHTALDRLARDDAKAGAVLAYFQWRLLRYVGLLGELTHCVGCGRELAGAGRKDLHFSSIQGGLLCGACEAASTEKYRLDGATLAGLAALAAAEAGTRVALPDKQAVAVNRLLAYHTAHQIGRALKMARHAIG